MKIYIRKIDDQCINKQISYTKEVLRDFLDDRGEKDEIKCVGKKSGKEYRVALLLSTDPRFDNALKNLLVDEGEGITSGDLMVMYKKKQYYIVEVVKQTDSNYANLLGLFEPGDRHVLLYDNEGEKNTSGTNIIFYGTPGCGKSYLVNSLYNVEGNKVYRTVFHPEYSNADFVGQIMPHEDDIDDTKVHYSFSEGIFTTALRFAYEHPSIATILIIEEINRGNASAIFGEIFQLLDRDTWGDSVYSIKNANIAKALGKDADFDIKIPSNLSLIATMNTSDQNVYTLDTAFKRRWNLQKIRNSFRDIEDYDNLGKTSKEKLRCKYELATRFIPGSAYTWKEFVERVNAKISEKGKGYFIQSEDKEIGVYFVSEAYLSLNKNDNDSILIKKFAEKVLMYLWNDVVKTNPEKLFKMTSSVNTPINSLDNLLDEFETIPNGDTLSVFSGDLFPSKNNNSVNETTNDCNTENVNE